MVRPARVGRRVLASAVAFAAFVLVGCSDQASMQPEQPDDPSLAVPAAPSDRMSVSSYVCPAAADIDGQITTLINTLYGSPQPSKTLNAQLTKYASFKSSLPKKPADAYKKLSDLASSALADLAQGKVNGINTPTATANVSLAEANISKLISLLYCYYNAFNGTAGDLTPPDFSEDLSEGATIGYFDPAKGTPQTFRSQDNQGGTRLPTDAYPEPLYITVAPILNDPSPLATDLDQYPLFYDFHAVPVDGSLASGDDAADGLTFTKPVAVSMCTENATSLDPALYARLRLAHNIGAGNLGDIEILADYTGPETNPAGLTCVDGQYSMGTEPASFLLGRALFAKMPEAATRVLTPVARFLMPEALSAASVVGFCCKSGATTSYSPFGAVDPLLTITKITPAQPYSAQVGTAITTTIEVTTAMGTKVRKAPWTVAPTADTDPDAGTTSDAVGAEGRATTTWTLNSTPGDQNLTFTVNAAKKVPATGYTPATAEFTVTATAVPTTTSFDWSANGWTWKSISSPTDADAIAAAVGSDDGFSAPVQGAFGMVNPPDTRCALYSTNIEYTNATVFGPNTVIAAKRKFILPGGATTGTLYFAIDNDMRVFVNGTERTADLLGARSTNTQNPGYFAHDDCPLRGDVYLPLTAEMGISATDNTLTVIAADRGGSTYFDASAVQVTNLQ